VLASLVAVLGIASVPALAEAAPHHNHGLTIAATPNPIIAGDAVLIYGQLNVPRPGNRTVVLYHRINPAPFFTIIGRTKTTSTGFYEFNRPQNPITELSVVLTNRSWFVRAPGLPGNLHSRTVHERVAAEVSLTPPTPPSTGFLTNQPAVFTGSVAPDHAGSLVLLQEQTGSAGNAWRTLKAGRLDGASQFSIVYRFRVPADHTVRVLFPADARNIAAFSDSVTVAVQQKENPHFTITTSTPIIPIASSATIDGVLSMPGLTTPDPGVMVTLWGRADGAPYAPITGTTTGTDGSYSFTVTPTQNEEYQVRTSFAPLRMTAALFVGVEDAVTLTPSSTTSSVGQSITFSGIVTPGKAGHEIELERLGADGHYHVVAIGFVNASSAYQFTWTFGTPGTKTFRVHISGGPENVGNSSNPVSIAVSLPPVTSLPPAS
jgi:hypothetical protein